MQQVPVSPVEAAITSATTNVASVVTLRSGREAKIYFCTLKQIPHLLKFARAVLGQVSAGGGIGALVQSMEGDVQAGAIGSGLMSVVDLLETNYEDMMTVIGLFTDLSADEFGNLALDEGVAVVAAIWGANKDFFIQRVLPVIQQLTAQMA